MHGIMVLKVIIRLFFVEVLLFCFHAVEVHGNASYDITFLS